MKIVYYHVKMPGQAFDNMRSTLDTQRGKHFPNNVLSVTSNVAGNEGLIKALLDDGFNEDQFSAPGLVIAKYPEAQHDQIFTWFYTPEWQPEQEGV